MTTVSQDLDTTAQPKDLDFDPEALRAKYREERDRRLRDDGNQQYVEVTGRFSHYLDDPYVEPGFTREALHDEVEVAVIASDAPPTGVGEPGTPPIGPAVANAVRRLTGKSIRTLPMVKALQA